MGKGKTSWESWKKVDFDSNAIDELLFASWAKALEAPMKHDTGAAGGS